MSSPREWLAFSRDETSVDPSARSSITPTQSLDSIVRGRALSDEARPPASAPGEGVLRVEIDTGHVIAIDAIALPNHDAAGLGQEARHLLHRHPARVAMQRGV